MTHQLHRKRSLPFRRVASLSRTIHSEDIQDARLQSLSFHVLKLQLVGEK